MSVRSIFFLVATVFVFSCMTPGWSLAQTELAQYGQNPPPGYYYQDDYTREERRREQEYRREERKRQKELERQERNYQRSRQQGYGTSSGDPSNRLQVQCNERWHNCATYCNTIRDANRRADCVANCNNELKSCN